MLPDVSHLLRPSAHYAGLEVCDCSAQISVVHKLSGSGAASMEPTQCDDQKSRIGFKLKADIVERCLDGLPLAESMRLHRHKAASTQGADC
jgi:hypothetical protein